MKVLVCGSRYYSDKDRVFAVLDSIDGIDCVVTGGCSGADTLGRQWAIERKKTWVVYEADWQKHATAAGPIRNKEMLHTEKPDLVIAFGSGKGTSNMLQLAWKAGYLTLAVPADGLSGLRPNTTLECPQ